MWMGRIGRFVCYSALVGETLLGRRAELSKSGGPLPPRKRSNALSPNPFQRRHMILGKIGRRSAGWPGRALVCGRKEQILCPPGVVHLGQSRRTDGLTGKARPRRLLVLRFCFFGNFGSFIAGGRFGGFFRSCFIQLFSGFFLKFLFATRGFGASQCGE